MGRHQVELYEIPFRLRGICGRALNILLPLAVWKRRLKITVKRNRRAAPVFSWEMYKNICWSSSARNHRDFQHEKRYDTNFMSYLLLPVKDYCFLPLHLPVPSMTFLKIAWSSSTDLPFSLAMATWRRADS